MTQQQGIVKPTFPRVLFVPQRVSVTTAPQWGGGAGSPSGMGFVDGVRFMGWGGTTTLLDEGAPSITCSHPRCSWSSSALPFRCVPVTVPSVCPRSCAGLPALLQRHSVTQAAEMCPGLLPAPAFGARAHLQRARWDWSGQSC